MHTFFIFNEDNNSMNANTIETTEFRLSEIERLNLTDPVGALKHDIERFLPYFVFVERDRTTDSKDRYAASGKISFCGMDKAPLMLGTEMGLFEVERMRMTDLLGFLRSTMPMENEDNSGWIIPLYEGNDFASQEDLNAYFHNLMYWESMLPATSFGPLTLRYGYSLMETYSLLKDSCEKKIQAAKDEEAQEQVRATKKERKRREMESKMMELQLRISQNEKQLQASQIEQNRRMQQMDAIKKEQEDMLVFQKKLMEERAQLEEEMQQLKDMTNE